MEGSPRLVGGGADLRVQLSRGQRPHARKDWAVGIHRLTRCRGDAALLASLRVPLGKGGSC